MKKLFTLLSLCAFMVSAAFAVSPRHNAEGFTFTPKQEKAMELSCKVNENLANFLDGRFNDVDMTKVIRREYWDGTDRYNMVMVNMDAKMTDYFSITNKEGKKLTFEEFPIYLNQIMLARYDVNDQNTAMINYIVCWPSYQEFYIYEESMTGNYDMVPLDEFVSKANDPYFCTTFATNEGSGVPGVFDNDAQVFTSYTIISNIAEVTQSLGNITGGILSDLEKFSMQKNVVRLKNFDEEEMTIEADFDCYVMSNSALPQTANLSCNYNGTFRQLGFFKRHYEMSVGEVHLFNCGIFEADRSDDFNYDNDFPPMQLYYIAIPNEYLEVECDATMIKFDRASNKLKWFWKDSVPESERDNDNMANMQGYLWAEPGTNIEEGIEFLLQAIPEAEKYTFNGQDYYMYKIAPEFKTIIPGRVLMLNQSGASYEPWSSRWGWTSAMGGYYWDWRSNGHNGSLSLHTEDGLQFVGYDDYGNTYSLAPQGSDIIYHSNPDNVHADIKKIANAGTFVSKVDEVVVDSRVRIDARDGKVTVAANDVEVSVYTLSGVRVAKKHVNGVETINLDGGIYVVKAGNKVQKVAL